MIYGKHNRGVNIFLTTGIVGFSLTGHTCLAQNIAKSVTGSTGAVAMPPVEAQLPENCLLTYRLVYQDKTPIKEREKLFASTIDSYKRLIDEGKLDRTEGNKIIRAFENKSAQVSAQGQPPPKIIQYAMSVRDDCLLCDMRSEDDRWVFLLKNGKSFRFQQSRNTAYVRQGIFPGDLAFFLFPGVGLPSLPFIRSVSPTRDKKVFEADVFAPIHTSQAEALLVPGEVSVEFQGKDNKVTKVEAYRDRISKKLCASWRFGRHEKIQGVLVASEGHMEVYEGKTAAATSISDFKLESAKSQSALPELFNLESYLPKNTNVYVDVDNNGKSIGFNYEPGRKIDDLLREETLRREVRNNDVNQGKGQSRTKTGIYVLGALLLGALSWYFRDRVRKTS